MPEGPAWDATSNEEYQTPSDLDRHPRDRAVPPQIPAEQWPDAGSFPPNRPYGNRNKLKSLGITAWRLIADFHRRLIPIAGQISTGNNSSGGEI